MSNDKISGGDLVRIFLIMLLSSFSQSFLSSSGILPGLTSALGGSESTMNLIGMGITAIILYIYY